MQTLNYQNLIKSELKEHYETINLLNSTVPEIENFSKLIINTLKRNNKLIICGNGGSAADAQHFSSELIGKYEKLRKSLPAISLSTDCSALTAIGNDYGFDEVFSREFDAIAHENDILIAISTSGNSRNILKLIQKSISKGIEFFIFTGATGGKLSNHTENSILVPSNETAIIQQCHILLGHVVCLNSELEYL